MGIYVELVNKKIRKSLGQMDVFTFEKVITEKLKIYEEK